MLVSLYDKVARVLLKLTFIHDPATLLKKRLWHRCFPVNFVKFLRTPFYREQGVFLLFIMTVINSIMT